MLPADPAAIERTEAPAALARGEARATAHHGEILQGVFRHRDAWSPALVTLPCPVLHSRAIFLLDHSGRVTVTPAGKTKAHRAAVQTLAKAGDPRLGGTLVIECEVAEGWGLGSSTCDVTAAIRAVAGALAIELPSSVIARDAVRAELASDSVMFGAEVVLFAHRDGWVIEPLGAHLPAMTVLGFNCDPTGSGVDTLSFPPIAYPPDELEHLESLRVALRRAVAVQDPWSIGQVATASARLHQRYLPKPGLERIFALAEALGALGVQVAHSGTVAGVLFDRADPRREAKLERLRAELETFSWTFNVGS